MFEIEAEEYATHNDWFEFSANVDKIGNAIRTKMERAYIAGAEFGYNKANEWHYVKDGDLPKTRKKVLVLLKDVEEPILDYYRQDGLWNYALEEEVIAWKEIVLPKGVNE